MASRRIRKRVIAGLGLFLILLLFVGQLAKNVDRDEVAKPDDVEKGGHVTLNSSQSPPESVNLEFTPSSCATIVDAKNRLKALEKSRISFVREYDDEESIHYEYLVKAPSNEEQKEISRICSEIEGVTMHYSEKKPVAWSEYLRGEYLFDNKYSYYVLTLSWNKVHGYSEYSVLGIKEGQLSYGKNGSAESADGSIGVIRMGFPVGDGATSRFDHVLDSSSE